VIFLCRGRRQRQPDGAASAVTLVAQGKETQAQFSQLDKKQRTVASFAPLQRRFGDYGDRGDRVWQRPGARGRRRRLETMARTWTQKKYYSNRCSHLAVAVACNFIQLWG
jgi:hypothetical protein